MVRFIADSTCDLSPELIKKYDIKIIPLYVRLGEEEFMDGVNITPAEIFRWSDEHGETPKTSAPSIQDIKGIIERNFEDEYIIFTISSNMSSCYSNVIHAALDLEMEDRIYVIDSENLSTGIGLQIIRAAAMAEKGMPAAEITEVIKSYRDKVRASFIIDTMNYLHRGGRCSGLAAMVGSALKIHPRIAVVDGEMRPEKKYRGKDVKYVMDYVQDMEAELKTARPDQVFITHSLCNSRVVNEVREYLESLNHFNEIIETEAGAVISSHCGPGTLGVLYYAE